MTKSTTISAAENAEQLIRDLTLNTGDTDETEMLKTLKNESLPGTCKSQFALYYRLTSD